MQAIVIALGCLIDCDVKVLMKKTYFSLRIWRNKADTNLEASSMMVTSQSVRKLYSGYQGESYQQSNPYVNPVNYKNYPSSKICPIVQ